DDPSVTRSRARPGPPPRAPGRPGGTPVGRAAPDAGPGTRAGGGSPRGAGRTQIGTAAVGRSDRASLLRRAHPGGNGAHDGRRRTDCPALVGPGAPRVSPADPCPHERRPVWGATA